MTHDRHRCFTGIDNGVVKLIRDEVNQKIFDLPDPCHSLNLVVKASLEEIPQEIKEFISNIHNYFNSPQRKERLKGIQIKNQLPVLLPKRYVKTRWLSLGDSLERIIQI